MIQKTLKNNMSEQIQFKKNTRKLIEITVFIGSSISEIYYVPWEKTEINLVGKQSLDNTEIHIPSISSDKKISLLNKNAGRWFINKSNYSKIKCYESNDRKRQGIILNELGPVEILNNEIYLIHFSVARILIRTTLSMTSMSHIEKMEDKSSVQSVMIGISFAIITFFFLGYFK